MGTIKENIEWVEYDILENFRNIKHATFLRHGGASKNHFASLNLSDKVGDNPEDVKINRELVREFLKLDKIIYANQKHSDKVALITKESKGVPEADALITKEVNIGLAVTHADCQAAIFYDPENRAIGAVHAGYQGLVKNIYKNTVEKMFEHFGSKPDNILVAISASIGPDHAEYKDYKTLFPEDFWSYQGKENYFDLREIAIKLLMDAGISDKNIEIEKTCTVCAKNDYFSYRRDHDCGRNATIVALNSL